MGKVVSLSAIVNSNNIYKIRYTQDKELTVEFHNGHIYGYEGVPEAVVLQLLGAESIGKFFHTNIRDGFKYRRIK